MNPLGYELLLTDSRGRLSLQVRYDINSFFELQRDISKIPSGIYIAEISYFTTNLIILHHKAKGNLFRHITS